MKKVVFGTVIMFGLSVFANAEWVTPKGVEKENWEDAKSICQSKGGRLPTKNELEKVITDCGVVLNDDDNNKANAVYQSCYKRKGFSSDKFYWSSTTAENWTNMAFGANFHTGYVGPGFKNQDARLRCIK